MDCCHALNLILGYICCLLGQVLKLLFKLVWKCILLITFPCRCLWRCIPERCMGLVGFIGGFALGQLYYDHLLMNIPFPYAVSIALSLGISVFLGLGNAVCRQMRCVSLLAVPMYCGKPGRSVLKAVVLTYVIAGPITNMGLNAKEVVRVFACSAQLSANLSRVKHAMLSPPVKNSMLTLVGEMEQVNDAFRSFREMAEPIEREIENMTEVETTRRFNNFIDSQYNSHWRSVDTEDKYQTQPQDTEAQIYQKRYSKKVEYRCQYQLSLAVQMCSHAFRRAYTRCTEYVPKVVIWPLCWPLKTTFLCNILPALDGAKMCDAENQVDPSIGESYSHLKKAKRELLESDNVKLHYVVKEPEELYEFQDATETGALVMHAFEEKHIIMEKVIMAVNICVAILFLRIIIAAATYHDEYLTRIGHDNIYITGYFKNIDERRKKKNEHSLLPLKKMERSKYVNIHSFAYKPERNKLFNQVLKVLLEMVTATTFVMLDRLFYEALDMVAQHAHSSVINCQQQDHEIQVKGKGALANVVRTVLSSLNYTGPKITITNKPCLPKPRSMPPIYFLKIYGGYLWILLLLYINPYTVRLRRLICSWFYPKREKQRILHLYNDILKKRLRMNKTLRRKAVQAVRAYYLSGENLRSLRLKFPRLLGWLSIFPAARKTCVICGETEPKSRKYMGIHKDVWHSCSSSKCPFVYCDECWREIDERCLACDPSLAELSDVDSLSDDEQLRY